MLFPPRTEVGMTETINTNPFRSARRDHGEFKVF